MEFWVLHILLLGAHKSIHDIILIAIKVGLEIEHTKITNAVLKN
jgi:hypothetical protein